MEAELTVLMGFVFEGKEKSQEQHLGVWPSEMPFTEMGRSWNSWGIESCEYRCWCWDKTQQTFGRIPGVRYILQLAHIFVFSRKDPKS